MIKIKEEHFIAKGLYQKCYRHPSNDELCIKISIQKNKLKHLADEIQYYKKISKRKIKKDDYQFFSRLHDIVETNLGRGYVYDLIKDETTQDISKTLKYYLLHPESGISKNKLKNSFERLVHLMIAYKVISNDMEAENVCCKILMDNSIELVHIDGLGHRDFIPLVDWFSYFAKKKIKRKLLRTDLFGLSD